MGTGWQPETRPKNLPTFTALSRYVPHELTCSPKGEFFMFSEKAL